MSHVWPDSEARTMTQSSRAGKRQTECALPDPGRPAADRHPQALTLPSKLPSLIYVLQYF